MHLPSTRVQKEMSSEEAAIWFVPANSGEELALLIKAPSSCIKALVAGCLLKLLFGRKQSFLNVGVRILDMPDAPVLISGAQRQCEEHEALAKTINERKIPVFLFNEMDVCLAWSNLEISEDSAEKISNHVGDVSTLYAGPFTDECSLALDCFCYSVDSTHTYPNAVEITLIEVDVIIEPWRINNVSFVGVRDYHTIAINDKDEGEMFERTIWASLESVFPLTLYKSPLVKIGEKTREFTDVLAFHEFGSFLIEAKDLSVLQAGYGRDQQRRTNGVKKQTKKAITQLVGAANALKRGDLITDISGNSLAVIRNQPAHCIVLITELTHWGDWSGIEQKLMEAMCSTSAFFHILDLREFISILKASSGNAARFDYNLIERCQSFAKSGSVHMRGRMAPKST